MTPVLPVEAESEVRQEGAEFFREHGWYLAPPVLDDISLEEAKQGLDEHWAGHRDFPLAGGKRQYADWMPGDLEGTRNNEYISLQSERIRRLAWSPVIGRIACEVAGVNSIRLFDDQMVFKPGNQPDSHVGWHVDGDYWSTCTSQRMLTAWIPLHDCPEEAGPLVVLDGSHRWSHLVDRSALSFHQRDMGSLEKFVTSLGYEFKPVAMAMRKGQFSLHHCRSIHGSYPNRAKAPRIALAVHMQDGENEYRPASRPDGRPVRLFNDSICAKLPSGLPDYSDPAVFPELWRFRQASAPAAGGGLLRG